MTPARLPANLQRRRRRQQNALVPQARCQSLELNGPALPLSNCNAEAAAQAAAEALVSQALKAGTSDNVTALVQAFEW